MTATQSFGTAEIARQLLSRPDTGLDVAFLIQKELKGSSTETSVTLYYAHHSRTDQAPTSAVVRLIQGVYATEPEQSRIIVRNRIYTTAALTAMCRGMIAVAAKRATGKILEVREEIDETKADKKNGLIEIPVRQIDLTNSVNGLSTELHYDPLEKTFVGIEFKNDRAWMDFALKLAQPVQTARENPDQLFLYNRPVAAVLVSPDGKLLEWAVNTNAVNKTLHAELNLVQSYYRKSQSKLPRGSRLYTTLKPCKMCAGMIHDAAEDMRSFEVIYAEDDPGPNARNTALEKFQRQFNR